MSTSDREPQAPSFERVRQLAKQLTRECRAGNAAALTRVRSQLPRLASLDASAAAGRVRLADVQHALAREAGVENWAALKVLVQSQEPLIAQVARFLRALPEGDLATMRRVLEQFPQVASTSIHAACAACDATVVERWLAKDATLATAKFRDTGWTPLACLTASPVFRIDDARRDASVAIGRRLLALGADANSFTLINAGDPNSKLSVLYHASHQGNAGLVKLLLEHGANPNDGESVYHAAEHDHRDVLDLLLAHGAEISAMQQPWGNTVLYFLAGYRGDHPSLGTIRNGMEWLLEHGADPNEPSYETREAPLHRLVAFGHGLEMVEMFLAHGADPRRARADGRTPYELAMRTGNTPVADRLRALGAGVEPLRPVDALLHACAIGDQAGALRALETPGVREELLAHEHHALVDAVANGSPTGVRLLTALGFDLGQEGPWGGTALHQAAWRGRLDVVRTLLAAGAPLNVRDKTYGSSPLGWAAHGSANCREADDEYIAVIDLLLDAGADRPTSINQWNEPPENLASDAVADHLRARGFAPEE